MMTWRLSACLLALAVIVLNEYIAHSSSYSEIDIDVGVELTLYEHRKRLISYIFSHYDRRVQPDNTPHGALNISIRLAISHLISVDDRTQTVNVLCWLFQAWPDQQCHWDPAKFGGISFIVIPYDMVWTPDTFLTTSLIMNQELVQNPENVKIETALPNRWINDGIRNMTFQTGSAIVRLMHPTRFSFSCPMFMNYFPFDIQQCELVLASVSQDTSGIDYYLGGENAVLESYKENDEWDVISVKQMRRVLNFECCEHGFATVVWRITIRRKSLYHLVNLVVPTIVVNLLATVGFFATRNGQPTGKLEDKVSLGVTTLLAFSIFLLTVSDQIPKGSKCVPLIGWFLLAIMVQTALSTLISIYISCPRRRRNIIRVFNYLRPLRERRHQQREASLASIRENTPETMTDLTANGSGLDRRCLLYTPFKGRRRTSYEIECDMAFILPETFCMGCCLAILIFAGFLPLYGYLITRNVEPYM